MWSFLKCGRSHGLTAPAPRQSNLSKTRRSIWAMLAIASSSLAAVSMANAQGTHPAPAQIIPGDSDTTIVASLSQNRVAITTSFSGSELFVFGAIRRDEIDEGVPLDIIVVVTGPPQAVEVRQKEKVLGIWTNGDPVRVTRAPTFYAVAATGPLDVIVSETEDLRHKVSLEQNILAIGAKAHVDNPEEYRQALIRLREKTGRYNPVPSPVKITEETLFTANIALPPNIVEGDYRARVFLAHSTDIIDQFESSIRVRKVGMEREIDTMAHDWPAIYGMLSLLAALLAGWMASEFFRRYIR